MQKLIRDKYVDIIEDSRLSRVFDLEHYDYMKEKLFEELEELEQSDFLDVNEFADVIEVLYALAKYKDISIEDINVARILKAERYGRFEDGIILNLPDDNTV